ncbi:MAG: hypothetical protein JRC92_08660 [Deltaproteobacteria bacterium]|nr:hypothetical protein [Deltaproteobacteria bacterium]
MSRPLDRVALVGAGTLGSQIALAAAEAGYEVRVFDKRPGVLDETLAGIAAELKAKGIEPLIPWDRWAAAQEAIIQATDMDEVVAGAELIIEAVPEKLEAKRAVFAELGAKASPEAILATNSSSIPISKIEDASGREGRCLNLHFYMILSGQNMVDIMGGSATLPQVIETGEAFVRSLNCLPLKVHKEILGFCFNRIWRAIKKEALYTWANGFVDFRDIDRGWRVFSGMPDGPFSFMDKIGLDVIYDIEMVYYNESKDPRDHPPKALKEMIDRGELGLKTGKGFYTYPDPEFLNPDFMNPKKQ